MRMRRDILLFGLLGAAALAGGWWLLAQRAGSAVDAYLRESGSKSASRQPTPVSAETFRATVCGTRRCVLVEAGGLAFLFGAGEGTGESLREFGLLRTDIDIVLLPELDLEAVEGLPGVARAVRSAGRSNPLSVNGPNGIVAVVDGANLLASSDAAVRLTVGPDGEDQGLAGRVVFDSGIVTIRMFASQDSRGRAYRVDFDDKSLVLAGCRAGAATILDAARGTKTVAGVLATGSEVLAPGDRTCADIGPILAAVTQGKLAATLVRPESAVDARAAWQELIASNPDTGARLADSGSQIDLTGEHPLVRE